jgi:predicted nucleotidyltransferase
MPLPDFDSKGDLPEGVHQATIDEVVKRFGSGTSQRQAVTARLLRIYQLVKATEKLERFIIFGSYITGKPEPNDVDIFMVMAEEFDVDSVEGELRDLFSNMKAQQRFEASVFWVNGATSIANVEDLIAGWQTKRDLTRRGIVEVIA